jgi:hypothetical protein
LFVNVEKLSALTKASADLTDALREIQDSLPVQLAEGQYPATDLHRGELAKRALLSLLAPYGLCMESFDASVQQVLDERATMLEGLENLGWPVRLVELPEYCQQLSSTLSQRNEEVARLRRSLEHLTGEVISDGA